MVIDSQVLLNKIINYSELDAPCSYKSTRKVLEQIQGLSRFNNIAEIGCGKGVKTLLFYEKSNAKIFAIDKHLEYTNYTSKKMELECVGSDIQVIHSNYLDLPFKKNELDMIWSEYAATEIGYLKALDTWREYISIGGYLCVCAYCWTKARPHTSTVRFWERKLEDIDTIENRIRDLGEAGFLLTSFYILPESDWWEYYVPFDVNSEEIIEKYPEDKDLKEFNKILKFEIDTFEKYGDEYCYAFFIGQKSR